MFSLFSDILGLNKPKNPKKKDPSCPVKTLLIGNGGIGKTTLMEKVVGVQPEMDFHDMGYVPTMLDSAQKPMNVDGEEFHLYIWDTLMGQMENSMEFFRLSYPDTNVFLVCFSVVDRKSFESAHSKFIVDILEHAKGVPFILVGTKSDLRSGANDAVTLDEIIEIAKKYGALNYFETSSVTGENNVEVFEECCRAGVQPARKMKKNAKTIWKNFVKEKKRREAVTVTRMSKVIAERIPKKTDVSVFRDTLPIDLCIHILHNFYELDLASLLEYNKDYEFSLARYFGRSFRDMHIFFGYFKTDKSRKIYQLFYNFRRSIDHRSTSALGKVRISIEKFLPRSIRKLKLEFSYARGKIRQSEFERQFCEIIYSNIYKKAGKVCYSIRNCVKNEFQYLENEQQQILKHIRRISFFKIPHVVDFPALNYCPNLEMVKFGQYGVNWCDQLNVPQLTPATYELKKLSGLFLRIGKALEFAGLGSQLVGSFQGFMNYFLPIAPNLHHVRLEDLNYQHVMTQKMFDDILANRRLVTLDIVQISMKSIANLEKLFSHPCLKRVVLFMNKINVDEMKQISVGEKTCLKVFVFYSEKGKDSLQEAMSGFEQKLKGACVDFVVQECSTAVFQGTFAMESQKSKMYDLIRNRNYNFGASSLYEL